MFKRYLTKLLCYLVLVMPFGASAATYYVRTDGGTAAQCTGLADAAYPGTGAGIACAWGGVMVALPPTGTPLLQANDTLVIGPGQHMVGYGAVGAVGCATAYPWDCMTAPVPNGAKVVGKGWNTTCPDVKPQIWGTERTGSVLRVTGATNVTLACLDITDHAECVSAPHPSACKRDAYPFGQWAGTGLFVDGAVNLTLQDLDIHGLPYSGMQSGRLTGTTTVNRVRIAANGLAGWNADIGATTSANSGNINISHLLIEWNGCMEGYPNKYPKACWGQTAGGYGDGFGSANTGGNWVIQDSIFRFNTSDGLDLLYCHLGCTVILDRITAEGNSGNQLKAHGNVTLTNSLVLSNCDFFAGKSFTYFVDDCRAGGDAISMGMESSSDVSYFLNNTIVGNSNVIALLGGPAGSTIHMSNNILLGFTTYFAGNGYTADIYMECFDTGATCATLNDTNNTKINLRHARNCGTNGVICLDGALPSAYGIQSATLRKIDPRLTSTSAHKNTGAFNSHIPALDYYGKPRFVGSSVDRGAVEAQ